MKVLAMSRRIIREDALRLARQYTREHENSSLAIALADPTVGPENLLAALLYACGFGYVIGDAAGPSIEFSAGATRATASKQLSFDKKTGHTSGAAVDIVGKAYLLLLAIEHDLDAAVYLPPDMRQERVRAVCQRIGVDEEFFGMVLRNTAF